MMAEQDFERLLGTIRVLNQQLEKITVTISQFRAEFSNTGSEEFSRALAQQRILAEQLSNELADAVNQYNRLQQAARQSATTTIPTPEDVRAERRRNRQGARSYPAGQPEFNDTEGRPAPNLPRFRERLRRNSSPFDTVESEIDRIERQRLETLRETLRSETRYKNALKMAEAQGYTLEDLKSVRTRGSGGIQQLQFEKYNQLGFKENLDIFSTPGGKATPGISNQFRTFGQGVLRDIGELSKWSLALAAVYGPLRKLGELTQEMIENQTKLAEATISVSSSFLDQTRIFGIAADEAEKSGESVSGVIDAFTQAYRASGGGADQVERLTTAQTLLSDSLVLSKLSTLDQASAIDTLSAALRQSASSLDANVDPLQQGSALLDKWVRVTKVANVDLTTLATGFAVLGDAAETAGMDIDQLNGLIAAIAETGISSGKETANIARSVVSGFQSDQARKELEALGIAVEDTTGQMRPLLDIMIEIYNLRKSGIIDDTQFSKLTLAIGGGTRRQAPVATLLENLDRIFAVSKESAGASGDAQEALAKQLDTVQTSLTKLANSFTELAQTLGTEGGFLSIIQGSVTGVTHLVGIFDELISVLGKATPALLAFSAASVVLKAQGRGGIQSALGLAGNLISPDMTNYEVLNRLNQVTGVPGREPIKPPDRTRQFIGGELLGKGAIGGAFQGLALSAIPALMNGFNEEDRFGKTKVAADIIGGVGGGIIGALVAGSPVIGAALGTAIAETFVNATIARKTDLFGYGNIAEITGPKLGKGDSKDLEKALKDAEIGIFESIGGGDESLGRFLSAGKTSSSKSLLDAINESIKSRDEEALNLIVNQKGAAGDVRRSILSQLGISPEMVSQAFASGQTIDASPERLAYSQASDEARKRYDKALAAYKAGQGNTEDISTAFGSQVTANKTLYQSDLDTIKEQMRQQLQEQRLTGDIKGADFARRNVALGGFDTKALQYYTALGDEFIKINKDVNSATDAFEAFGEILVSGATDSIPEITSIVTEIQKLENILGDPTLQDKDALESLGFKNIDEVKKKLVELKQVGASTLTDVYNQVRLDQLPIPEIQGDVNKPLKQEEFGLVKQTAIQMQEEFYKGFLDIPDQMYEGLKESWDAWAQIIEDSGQVFYETVSGIDPQFFQQAMAKLMEQGKILSQKTSPFGIQQLDMTSQQGAGLQGTIDYFSGYLAKNFPQYKQNPEDVGVIFSDYVTDVLHGDNLAIKLALEKLVDINQKQLDGMYNIPEGATFWVPLTAAYYKPKNEGGGAGMPPIDSTVVDGNTTATERNTSALDRLREEFSMRKGEAVADSEENKANKMYKARPTPNFKNIYEREKRIEERDASLGLADSFAQRGRGYGRNRSQEGGERNFTELLREAFLKTLMTTASIVTGRPTALPGTDRGASAGTSVSQGSIGSRNMANVSPTVTARLDLRFDNNVQLIVDGRVLASIVTPYLASDLVKLEASQGTITKRYVI